MSANDRQIGGTHYQGEIQHWDYAWSHKFDLFQYIITKWIERWRVKGGIEDLKKARHAIDKYIEVVEAEEAMVQSIKAGAGAGPGYVNQD